MNIAGVRFVFQCKGVFKEGCLWFTCGYVGKLARDEFDHVVFLPLR